MQKLVRWESRDPMIRPMAQSSTVFTFEIDLADADRAVYENLALRVARHPSESDEFLIARVLAYCLDHQEGIDFSRGLCDADDPPIVVKDLTGSLRAWIDVGTPSAERLHRASQKSLRESPPSTSTRSTRSACQSRWPRRSIGPMRWRFARLIAPSLRPWLTPSIAACRSRSRSQTMSCSCRSTGRRCRAR